MKEDCIFCKIVNGKIPSMKVYEDDVCLAYLDINPDSDGHTLIIPKKHYTDIYELPKEVLEHIFDVAKTMMNDLKGKLNCTGYTLMINYGSSQEVKHFHLHVKPQYEDKKFVEFIKHKELLKDTKEVHEIIKGA